jgi:hypothetical protein
MNSDAHLHTIAFRHALTTMDAKKDGERSGYSTRNHPVPHSIPRARAHSNIH